MSEVSFEPNSDRVLCTENVRETTESGIYMPPSANNTDAVEAQVVAVGKGRLLHLQTSEVIPLPYKPGDVVLLDPIGGIRVTLSGKKYRLVRVEEILGKVR